MNILFFHTNGIIPESGGISRITYNLARVFRDHGINVFFIGYRNLNTDYIYDKQQFFLPNQESLITSENIHFFVDLIAQHNIKIIINQAALSDLAVKFIASIREQQRCRIISCMHNSILTPIDNIAYQKEHILKKYKLSTAFRLLNYSLVKKNIRNIYILKYRKKYKRIFNNSDIIVNLIPELANEFEEMANVTLNEKSWIIPNCLDICKHPNFEKQKIILWVGTIDMSVKRVDYMIDIWKTIHAQIPDWELQILGDGPALMEAKIYANKLCLPRISFMGRVNPQQYYDKASLLVVTSSHESFSLVSVEAMSNGVVPIINNSFPAAKIITDNGSCGILANPFDLHNISNEIVRLCHNDTQRIKLSKKAYDFSHTFNSNNVYNHWLKLFTHII